MNRRAAWRVAARFVLPPGVKPAADATFQACAGARRWAIVERMALEHKQAGKPKRSGRTTLLAGLLAVVAALAVWLSNCIPGFGIGGGEGEGEAENAAESEPAKPAEAEPESEPSKAGEGGAAPEVGTARKPVPLKLTIDARDSCTFADGQALDCATICENDELFEGVDSVIIDAKNASQDVVVDVLDCLKTKKLAVSIERN